MAVERTLILAEPDAVARGLSGESVARFERRGFVLGAPLLRVDGALAEQHSAEHIEKPFLGKLVDFIPSSPTLAFVLAEEGAIATNLADAGPGSPRGSCSLAMPSNLVRGSDSPESAEREIAVWFADVLV
jgi:nucleoside-diphosphate kinase